MRELTEIAHDHKISTDYHINEGAARRAAALQAPGREPDLLPPRGAHHEPWNCRAGQNTVIIRVDGTLAPCFPMYSASHDRGVVGEPKFDRAQLLDMKATCEPNCFSTLNHIVGWCYNDARVVRWLARQALHGFQGVRGNFE
ncbi:MAG: hypothetical protein ACM3SQ_17935 [Betaproteobacteria bacterium]